VGYVALANMFPWVVEKVEQFLKQSHLSNSHLSNLELLEVFLKKKYTLYSSNGTLKSLSGVYFLTKA
jgi:hypothetical protein